MANDNTRKRPDSQPKPPWCETCGAFRTGTVTRHDDFLRKVLDAHYESRVYALENVMTLLKPPNIVGPATNNILSFAFVDEFYSLLNVDVKCLCAMVSEPNSTLLYAVGQEPQGAGKVGVILIASLNTCSEIGSYYSTRMPPPSDRKQQFSDPKLPQRPRDMPELRINTTHTLSSVGKKLRIDELEDLNVSAVNNFTLRKISSEYSQYDTSGLPNRLIIKGIKNIHVGDGLNTTLTKLNVQEVLKMIPESDSVVFRQENETQRDITEIYEEPPRKTDQIIILGAGGDSFATQTCIHMILNIILNTKVPNYLYQYDAWICTPNAEPPSSTSLMSPPTPSVGVGYNVTEFANAGDLSSFLEEHKTLSSLSYTHLLRQVLLPLAILKQTPFFFVHGDLKTKNVFVTRIETNADNFRQWRPSAVSFIDDYVFKIADFDKSSIFWNKIRFYNDTYSLLRPTEVPAFERGFGGTVAGHWNVGEASWYRFGTTGSLVEFITSIQVYSMFSPIGFFTSFDVYTFFISLLLEPSVFSILAEIRETAIRVVIEENGTQTTIDPDTNEKDAHVLWQVWQQLWLYADDEELVWKDIQSNHAKLASLFALNGAGAGVGNTEQVNEQRKLMQSIVTCIDILVRNKVRMRYDMAPIYSLFDINESTISYAINKATANTHTPPDSIFLSKNGHICLDECVASQATTPSFLSQLQRNIFRPIQSLGIKSTVVNTAPPQSTVVGTCTTNVFTKRTLKSLFTKAEQFHSDTCDVPTQK